MTQPLLPHSMRPATDGDMPLILNAWVEELRHAPCSRFVRSSEYFPDQRRLVLELVHSSQTIVACNPEDSAHVYGFVTFGPGDVIHWLYVKSHYRGIGMADLLLAAAFPQRPRVLYATQASSKWHSLQPAIERRGIVYRPHLLQRAS